MFGATPRSQQFLEVYAIVRARDWVLPMYHRDNYMMVPVVDMLNYGQVGLRVHFDSKRHAFIMYATEAVDAGKELLFFYGTFCKEAMVRACCRRLSRAPYPRRPSACSKLCCAPRHTD